MAYQIKNISTTNLAMADGSNLAPGQSKSVIELSANLQYLVSIRSLSAVAIKPVEKKEVIVSAPAPEPDPVNEERRTRRKYKETE